MTIPATPSQRSYDGDGVSLAFTIPFVFDTSADIKVVKTSSVGLPTVLTTGFSITGGGGSTGTCTMSVAPAVGETLTLLDNPELTQTADYISNDAFPAESHERALDRTVRLVKRLYQITQRSFRVQDGDLSDGDENLLPIASVRAGKYPVFDALGNITVGTGTGGGDAALRTDLAKTVAGTEGSSLVGFRAAPAGAVARTTRSKLRDIVDARDFGVLADGVTDDTAAWQAAAASGAKYIVGPEGSTKITASIVIASGQRWFFNNTNFVLPAGGLVKAFTATTVNDWSIGGRWTVTGDNLTTGATAGTGAALLISDCMRFDVRGLIAIQIKGWGVLAQPGASSSTRGEKGVVQFQAHGCYVGFETQAGTGAEYITFDVPVMTRCATGAKIAAGNTEVNGGKIVDNTLGVWLLGGANHLHGSFNGTLINHNVTQIHADGVTAGTITLGHAFNACKIYQGIIHLNHARAIVFKACDVDVDAYQFEETDGCEFIDCLHPGTYANAITNDFNASHSHVLWENCRDTFGQPFGGALGNIKGIRVTNALAANQVFSAANVNATSVIKLDDSANASANQATQTVVAYDAFSAATGIYTCVKGGNGKVRIAVQLVITCNAADAGKFQCYVSHSVLGDYYFTMTPMAPAAAATTWIATLDIELPIDLANTLTFKIGSFAGGVANNVTVTNSGGTKAQVEGL
jgi:hypothetical protein